MFDKHHFSISTNNPKTVASFSETMIVYSVKYPFVKYKELFDNIPVDEPNENDFVPFNGDDSKEKIFFLRLIPSKQYYFELYGSENPTVPRQVYEKNLTQKELIDFLKIFWDSLE
jgi:hypothetical protein